MASILTIPSPLPKPHLQAIYAHVLRTLPTDDAGTIICQDCGACYAQAQLGDYLYHVITSCDTATI